MRLVRVVAAAFLLPACLPGTADVETTTEDSAVLGGSNAPLGKWPDVVAVRQGSQQFCTGTLIAPTVAITAGHCNEGIDNVLIGTNSLSRPADGEAITVLRTIEYPNSQSTGADLTVMVLARESRFEPRALATGWARHEIKNQAMIEIVGYGAIDQAGNQYIPDLQEATTVITDADCTTSSGCVPTIKPGGELGAGGMGIDTCFGDSGGPLYLPTDFGTFLAGATSRGYDNNMYNCSEGGIYVRPDKFVDWIEKSAGVGVRRGPEPAATMITAIRGNAGETHIEHNDPHSTEHTYAIKTAPMYGTAKVRDDGQVRVCTNDNVSGGDSMVVTVTDKKDPTRAEDVKINILINDGDPGSNCDVEAFGDGGGDGGGCCDSGRSAGGALPLSAGVLALLVRRRRRR